jgi:hypothetical protein
MTAWMIDAVALACLTPDEAAALRVAAEGESQPDLRGKITDNALGDLREGLRGRFHWDRRDGRTRIRVERLILGNGVSYSSENDRLYATCGMGSDDTSGRRVHFSAVVSIRDAMPPDTVIDALPGRPVSCLVAHPALPAGMDIVSFHVDDPGANRPKSFSVRVPTILVPLP